MRAAVLALLAGIAGCHSAPALDAGAVRREIDGQLQRVVQSTVDQDIDAYMDGLPPGFTIHDERGDVISRDQQRANILRDWAVIPETIYLRVGIDSLSLANDSVATVYTWQRWERTMLRPDRPGHDSVLTTQRHRETWRPTPAGWRLYDVHELGGDIWINGAPYTP